MTVAVRDGGVLLVAVMAFVPGQLVLHAGGSLVHEAAHRLVLTSRAGRWTVDLLLEVLLHSFGHHAQYQRDHIHSHHPYLGDYTRDYEHKDALRIRSRARLRATRPRLHAALIGLHLLLDALPLGFLVSDDLVEAIERRVDPGLRADARRCVPRVAVPPVRRGALAAVSIAVLASSALLLGPWSLLFLVWSLSFFQGRWAVTNVGQVLSEHSDTDPETPTRSDYGLWNRLLFNTGHHDEHHTFPGVPWNRLPTLRALAPHGFPSPARRGYLSWWYAYVLAGAPRRPSAMLAQTLATSGEPGASSAGRAQANPSRG